MICRRRQRPFGTLKLVVMKIEGERDNIKGLVDMMIRERTTLHGRRGDI